MKLMKRKKNPEHGKIKKKELIGTSHFRQDELKKGYWKHYEDHPCYDMLTVINVSVYKVPNKYGILIELDDKSFSEMLVEAFKPCNKPVKRIKRLKKTLHDDELVDTKAWVHPDFESIQNEMIKQFCLLQLLDEDSKAYWEHLRILVNIPYYFCLSN